MKLVAVLLLYYSLVAFGFLGPYMALYAIYTDQSGNTTEGVGIVYLICTVLIGIVLFLCWQF